MSGPPRGRRIASRSCALVSNYCSFKLTGELTIKREIKAVGGKTTDKDKRVLMNEDIRAREVRLIGFDGSQVGIVPLAEALAAAETAGVDLVQIADADPVVCKVMDYNKYVYEDKQQQNEAKK